MGWSAPVSLATFHLTTELTAMNPEATHLGIDLGKNWFHVIGMDLAGRVVLRKRLNRVQLGEFAAAMAKCRVAMESCPGSQYWGRRFAAAGHEVRIIPAQFVKPYLKSNKNDYNDAEAIAEAGSRGTMRCVPLKNAEQLELQATHRVRQRFIIERSAVVNQMRALLLEHGIAIPIGRALFARRFPDILADAEHALSVRLRMLLQRLRARWLSLDVEIVEMTALLTDHAAESELCRRAITVPGVGPIVSTALVAAVNNARVFARGRDMAAWLGLVPRQHSTGGKTTLGRISKRGNAYLRQLFIQGAQALYTHMKREKSRLGQWLRDLEVRAHRHVVVVALANKIVRICWKVLTSSEDYRPFPGQPT
jgi:transposase